MKKTGAHKNSKGGRRSQGGDASTNLHQHFSSDHYNLDRIPNLFITNKVLEDKWVTTDRSPVSAADERRFVRHTICGYWPEFPKSRSTAAWTLPEVAIRALMFSCVSKKPISCSCESWVAYNCSGGSITHPDPKKEKWKVGVSSLKIY